MNTIQLIAGDWSGDGHNMTDVKTINTNYLVEKIKDCYKQNSNLLNFNMFNFCHHYEDNIISKEVLKPILKILNVNLEFEDNEDDDEDYYISCENWVKLYLSIVSYNNPDFQYEIITPTNSINIGGYGLFSM